MISIEQPCSASRSRKVNTSEKRETNENQSGNNSLQFNEFLFEIVAIYFYQNEQE